MLGSKKYCCLQRIALPEAATHVASVGDRSAVNFMLKLSCFYFCKWLLPIQDVEIRQCTVTACSTTPVYCHSMQHTTSVLSQHAAQHEGFNVHSTRDADNSWKGTGWFAEQQCSVIELNGTSGNASHSIGRIYITMLYHQATWLNRKCFSLFLQY